MAQSAKPGIQPAVASTSNFIRSHIDADLASGKYAGRSWGGRPGPAQTHRGQPSDPANIRTRFPPEPNGYLHIGHAKSICLNFGLARANLGKFNLRFDDTNPAKEELEYVESIKRDVRWLGAEWDGPFGGGLYWASDCFEEMYRFARELIAKGKAYVCDQSAQEVAEFRGPPNKPGRESPFRSRPPEKPAVAVVTTYQATMIRRRS